MGSYLNSTLCFPCVTAIARNTKLPPRIGVGRPSTSARQLRAQRSVTSSHPADGASLDRITDTFNEILHSSGYTNPKTTASTEQKVRRMVRRLGLTEKDADMWLGMLRQIRWKVDRQE